MQTQARESGLERLDMRRVENLVGRGTPDVEGCWDGRQFWIELKGADRPGRRASPVRYDLTRPQVLWHRRRWACGGAVWLYLRVGRGVGIKRYLIPGCHSGLVEQCVTEDQLAELTVLPPDHKFTDFLRRVVYQ